MPIVSVNKNDSYAHFYARRAYLENAAWKTRKTSKERGKYRKKFARSSGAKISINGRCKTASNPRLVHRFRVRTECKALLKYVRNLQKRAPYENDQWKRTNQSQANYMRQRAATQEYILQMVLHPFPLHERRLIRTIIGNAQRRALEKTVNGTPKIKLDESEKQLLAARVDIRHIHLIQSNFKALFKWFSEKYPYDKMDPMNHTLLNSLSSIESTLEAATDIY